MTRSPRTNRDHAKQQQRPMVEDEVIAAQLENLVTPAITAQENYYRKLGMRDRILNLPFMIAAVLTLLWRDVAGVRELTRMLGREGFLWCSPTQVSQQAISQRFLTFPAELFERVFKELLPEFSTKWHRRKQRPLPQSLEFASTKFERVWACDGSTLEALFKKLNSLEDVPIGQLAGKMGVVIDLITRLPIEIWFRENPKASDINFESDILNLVQAKTLLLLDRGCYHFLFWQQLIDRDIHFITRLKKGATFRVEKAFTDSYSIRDRLIQMGYGTEKSPYVTLRLVEMIYRGLYHFSVAHQKGIANDPIKYFASPSNQDLGVVKTIRKPNVKLIIAPFPEHMRSGDQFFFEPSSQTHLTTAIAS
jgi:hypothetical protein